MIETFYSIAARVRELVQDIIARLCAFHRAVIARVRTLLAAIVRPSGE